MAPSIPRLLVGVLWIDFATLFGAFLGGWGFSLVYCLIALTMVRTGLYAAADLLDRKRWASFWKANVLGYWLVYLVAYEMIWKRSLWALWPTFVVAFLAGIAFVIWKDKSNKEAALTDLAQWRKQKENEKEQLGRSEQRHRADAQNVACRSDRCDSL
ncbi:MAG: hypothetical protein JSV93_00515 [Candidatus Omnitrophota bacterium]|nr:MAG: hypothetical protein JSV93_00515 [Candidatus Omnitrophota bacterium]